MLVCVQREVRGWHVGVCSKGGEGMACWCVSVKKVKCRGQS